MAGADPIVSRQRIAQLAEEAAKDAALRGTRAPNPYPLGSDAHRAWQVTFERYLQQHAAPDCEASA